MVPESDRTGQIGPSSGPGATKSGPGLLECPRPEPRFGSACQGRGARVSPRPVLMGAEQPDQTSRQPLSPVRSPPVKKGRHRRFEEARKLKQAGPSALDLGLGGGPSGPRSQDDEYAAIAEKYGVVFDEDDDEEANEDQP